MSAIYEGNICISERDDIKFVVDKIQNELPFGLNTEIWGKLQDIIYFRKEGGEVTVEWKNFLDFVSVHSVKIIDFVKLGDIIADLEQTNKNMLKIDEAFCSSVNIHLDLIKNEFIQKIVHSIRDLLNEWNGSNQKEYHLNEQFLKEWGILYKDLKSKTMLLINTLWENILSDIVFNDVIVEVASANNNIMSDIATLCYDFEI